MSIRSERSLRLDLRWPREDLSSRRTMAMSSVSPVMVSPGLLPERKKRRRMRRMKPAMEPRTMPATAAGAGPSTLYTLGMTAVPPLLCRLSNAAALDPEIRGCGIRLKIRSARVDVSADMRGRRFARNAGGIGAIAADRKALKPFRLEPSAAQVWRDYEESCLAAMVVAGAKQGAREMVPKRVLENGRVLGFLQGVARLATMDEREPRAKEARRRADSCASTTGQKFGVLSEESAEGRKCQGL